MRKNLPCSCAANACFVSVTLLPGLPAWQCPDCSALLVYLTDYHRWRELHGKAPPLEKEALSRPAKPEKVRLCPDCGRVMIRHQVSHETNFRLDRCDHCALIRFDDGEWQTLRTMGLAERLPEILSDSWQRRLQEEAGRARRRETLRHRLGDETLEELLRIQSWLRQQPNHQELLSLLSGEAL